MPCHTLLYKTELRPNCSSNRRTLTWIGLAMAAAMAPISIGFGLMGAWPVFGFMGVELLAMLALLICNFRRNNLVERVIITKKQVHVEKVYHSGQFESWAFPRYWARVKLLQAETTTCQLEVSSHGYTVPLGNFLTAQERQKVWSELNQFISSMCYPKR